MMADLNLMQQVDALLPQTQCGQCSYGGCLPYAEAIVSKNEKINRCPPGGVKTLVALGKLLAQDVSPLIANMQAIEQPPQLAKIRAQECIGCTKCIQACPVDAILGAAKQLHVVINAECTGCGLCVAPCPVDCIDLTVIAKSSYDPAQARARFKARQARKNKVQIDPKTSVTECAEKSYVLAAVMRAKAKKNF